MYDDEGTVIRDIPKFYWTDLRRRLIDVMDHFLVQKFGLHLEKAYAAMFPAECQSYPRDVVPCIVTVSRPVVRHNIFAAHGPWTIK